MTFGRKVSLIAGIAFGGGSFGFGFGFWYAEKRDEIRSRKILKYGLPESETQIIPYESYLLCYDRSKKIPIWVAERLDLKTVKGDADRKKLDFTVEPRIPSNFTSKNDDYFRSGWSRGHMAAAGNYKSSIKEMSETFFLSNVVPQDVQNNGGYWNLMEIYIRDLVKKFEQVYVYSGPLFLPSKNEETKKEFVQYQVIGKNKVAVPTHLYKLIVAHNQDQEPILGAFVVPNRSIPFDEPLQKYEVTLESLESNVGVEFVPKLNRKRVKNLCSVDGCKLMDVREFTKMYLSRRLSGARTLYYLEKDWSETKEKGLADDDEMKKMYETKLKELQNAEKVGKTKHKANNES